MTPWVYAAILATLSTVGLALIVYDRHLARKNAEMAQKILGQLEEQKPRRRRRPGSLTIFKSRKP